MTVARAGLALALALLAGCATPRFGYDNATRAVLIRDTCQAQVPGWHWYRKGPHDAAVLLARIEPVLQANGYEWFTSGKDGLAVCAYETGGACGDRIEYFERVDGRWEWRRDAGTESICLIH